MIAAHSRKWPWTGTARLVAWAAALSASRPVQAGGLDVGDSGGEVMGRGGAYVAKADSAAALLYNPAGLANVRGFQSTLSLDAINYAVTFQQAGGGYPVEHNATPWFVVPQHMVLSYDFGLPELALAIGYYAPTAPSSSFTRAGTAGNQQAAGGGGSIMVFPTIGLGLHLGPTLDVGATFQSAYSNVNMVKVAQVSSACPNSQLSPDCNVTIHLTARDDFAPTGSAGLLWRPADDVSLGAAVTLPSTSKMTGKANIKLGPNVQQLQASMTQALVAPQDPQVTVTNTMPWMIRAGARYILAAHGGLMTDIEADFTYESWSMASKKQIDVNATSLGQAIAPMVVDWKLKDTYGARIGGTHELRLGQACVLALRAGVLYETKSTTISDTNLNILGPQHTVATAGVGLRWGPISLDFAYAHFFVPERIVVNSTITSMEFGGGTPTVIGNGSYGYHIVGFYAQMTYALGSVGVRRRPDAASVSTLPVWAAADAPPGGSNAEAPPATNTVPSKPPLAPVSAKDAPRASSPALTAPPVMQPKVVLADRPGSVPPKHMTKHARRAKEKHGRPTASNTAAPCVASNGPC
jgi:long-subunit fatty acid transport protein